MLYLATTVTNSGSWRPTLLPSIIVMRYVYDPGKDALGENILGKLQLLKEGTFIATIDVDSLYTNIDNTNGLEAVKQIFNKNPDPNRPDKDILELLKINLENNDFEFNSQWYLQTWGASMGKKFAPNYAN